MSLFLARLPLWLGALLVVILPTALAMAGPVLVRRRFSLERLTTNNEIAGFKFATVGVIYAVLLGFAVIIVRKALAMRISLVQEGGGWVATLYRSTGCCRAGGADARGDQRLPARGHPATTAKGKTDPRGDACARCSLRAHARAHAHRLAPAWCQQIFRQLDGVTQARRARLHLATGIVPGMLWAVLVLGGVLTVGFTFFFGTRNLRAQVLMTGILSLIVFMGLFVIVSINHPFTGPAHIDSEPLQAVLDDFAGR